MNEPWIEDPVLAGLIVVVMVAAAGLTALAISTLIRKRREDRRNPFPLFLARTSNENADPDWSSRRRKLELSFPTTSKLESAYAKAKAHIDKCSAARLRHDLTAAERHLEDARNDGGRELGPNHWFASFILHEEACILYARGHYLEAREIWERAYALASDWPDRASAAVKLYEKCINDVTDMLGF